MTDIKVKTNVKMLTKPLTVKNDTFTLDRSSEVTILFSYQRKKAIDVTPA